MSQGNSIPSSASIVTKSKPMTPLMFALEVVVIIVFVFFFPRFLTLFWGPEEAWLNFFYTYGLGLMFFAVGIQLNLRAKAVQLNRGRDRFWFTFMLFGFVFFFTLHGLWTMLALYYPVKTGV